MRFRELLILKRREWIPIVAAVLLNAIVTAWAMWQFANHIDTHDYGSTWQIVDAIKVIGILLILFSFVCWLLRFNRWIKEPKEA